MMGPEPLTESVKQRFLSLLENTAHSIPVSPTICMPSAQAGAETAQSTLLGSQEGILDSTCMYEAAQ